LPSFAPICLEMSEIDEGWRQQDGPKLVGRVRARITYMKIFSFSRYRRPPGVALLLQKHG